MRFSLVLAVLLVTSAPALSDDYVATSKTAMSITGDISFDDSGITFANGETLAFSELVADHFEVDGEAVPGSVYRIAEPADPELENGNQLCGAGDVTYLANWADGDTGSVIAVFTGEEEPTSNAGMCASYSYETAQ
jgi:hypothetical protein